MRSPGDQHTPEFLAGHTPVAAAAALLPAEPLLISADMELPVFVQASTSIRDAFRIMRENQLESIPLVDEEQRVIGELDLVELLLLWLRVLQGHVS